MSQRNGKVLDPHSGNLLKGLRRRLTPSRGLRPVHPVLLGSEAKVTGIASNDHRARCRKKIRLLLLTSGLKYKMRRLSVKIVMRRGGYRL